jgi:hypothetical protein
MHKAVQYRLYLPLLPDLFFSEDKQFGDAFGLTGTPAEALAPFAQIFLKLRVVIAHLTCQCLEFSTVQ